MPSTRLRPRATVTDADERPLAASFAAAFGGLLAVEVLFLGGLMVLPDARLDRVTVVVVVLAVAAITGSLMVFQGRRGGWILLVLTALGSLAALLMLVLVLGALGVTAGMWAAVLLTVGPLGCLVLAPRRSVRRWGGSRPTRRPAGGRRGPARSH